MASFLNGLIKGIANVLVSLLLVVWSFGFASAQFPSQDPGPREAAEIRGIKFSVPKGFKLERPSDSGVAFMRHQKYDLAVFISVPEKHTDDAYLTSLSNVLVSQLFPREKDFRWKLLSSAADSKVSKFQTGRGGTKGFNNRKLFQTHYITVNVKDHEVLVGYITQLGQFSNDAKQLFDQNGDAGMSMPGWYAQAHILASVTGEKYEQINPGTFIRTTPVTKN